MTKWDARFMDLARLVATWSKDPSTQVGSVIVDSHRRVLSLGYNGFPRFVNDREERYLEKETKYKLIVHAEANAILNATAKIVSSVLYCTMYPCSECAKLIVQSGVGCVVCPPPRVDGRWAEDSSFSQLILREALVEIVQA